MSTCGGCGETCAGPTCPRCVTQALPLLPDPRSAPDAAPSPVAGRPELLPSRAPRVPGAAVTPPPTAAQWVPAPRPPSP